MFLLITFLSVNIDQTFTFNEDPFITYEPYTITLEKGRYLFQCWGAQGSESYQNEIIASHGGKGAYTEGIISLTAQTKFYIYVGGQGKTPTANEIIYNSYKPIGLGGKNGGGDGGSDMGQTYYIFSGGGGGATDIRKATNNIKSRIMVAAGGSGAAGDTDGAPGGNQTGLYWFSKNKLAVSKLTTQSKGGANGIGQNGNGNWETPGSGGGGGYYGGVVPTINEDFKYSEHYKLVGHSGSSFINNTIFYNESLVYKINAKEGHGKARISSLPACKENCGSCNANGNICYSCTNYKNLHNGQCVVSCPKGTYNNDPPEASKTKPNGRVCESCPKNCSECKGPTICSSCDKSYYLFTYATTAKCILNCSEGNNFKNNNKQYGIDKSSSQKCGVCQVENCIDCWSDNKKCDKCKDSYYFDGQNKCVIKPTDSKQFSLSSPFSRSNIFVDSSDFTLSSFFSKSDIFVDSSDFTFSSLFSKSDAFSYSSDFSLSSHFSKSGFFADSTYFTLSSFFSNSNIFTDSSSFIAFSLFSKSISYSDSLDISFSTHFASSINNDDDSSSIFNKYESSISNSEELSFSNSEESSNINNEELSISNSEEFSSANNEESSISNSEEFSSANNEESSISNSEESSSANNEEFSSANNEESSISNSEESSSANNEESSISNSEESSSANNEESSSANNEESPNSNNIELSTINNIESSDIFYSTSSSEIKDMVTGHYSQLEPPINIIDSTGSKKKSFNLWWVPLLVAVAVIILVIIIIFIKKKKKEEKEKETDTQEANSATGGSVGDQNSFSADNPLYDNIPNSFDPFDQEYDEEI